MFLIGIHLSTYSVLNTVCTVPMQSYPTIRCYVNKWKKAAFYNDIIYKYTPVWRHISWLLE